VCLDTAHAHVKSNAILKALLAGLLVVCCSAGRSRANAILGEHDWDPGPHGWTNAYGWTVLDRPASDGNPGGWLRVAFTNTSETPDESWSDIVRVDASNLFAGVWEPNMWVEFDFWASNQSPNALQVRWQSSTNSYIWGHVLTPAAAGGWTTYGASFMNWDDWDIDPFGTEDQYLADLASIDWIGVYINRNTEFAQVYGIDNFRLMIPEPAEMLLLAAAAAVSAMSARKKKRRTSGSGTG